MHHGNGLAYYNNELYVAPCSNYCVAVSTINWSYKVLPVDVPLQGIAHYKGKLFFTTRNNTITIAYRLGDKLEKVISWEYINPLQSVGYSTPQGIAYRASKDKIYIVYSHSDLRSNIILRLPVGGKEPDYILTSKKETRLKYYEFEGIGFNKNDEMFIGGNLPNGDILFKC